MGRYFRGGVIFIWVVILESEYTRTEAVDEIHILAVALTSTNLAQAVIVIAVLMCAMASKFTPGAIPVWVVTTES